MIYVKPCPFCGSIFISLRKTNNIDNVNNEQYTVYCNMCSASGGMRTTKEKAIKTWNRRLNKPTSFTELMDAE